MKRYKVYVDGSFDRSKQQHPNAGWACIFIENGHEEHESSYCESGLLPDSFAGELEGVLLALRKAPKNSIVEIWCDNKALVNSFNNRITATNFDNKLGHCSRSSNKKRWQLIIRLAKSMHVSIVWVKGHSEDKFNRKVDALAKMAKNNKLWQIEKPSRRLRVIIRDINIAMESVLM